MNKPAELKLDTVPVWINGKAVLPQGRMGDVFNPATGQVTKRVPYCDGKVIDAAARAASAALPEWRDASILRRARVMQRFLLLLQQHQKQLAGLITEEHGKTLPDAMGSVQRGIEVVEFACGIPQLLKGEYSENVGTAVDTHTVRQAVGVCAGITPFNFPVMVPMWMFPMAIACGNSFILKPSEKVPSASIRMAELFKEAGLPDGVFNVVHGDKAAVDAILNHPLVKLLAKKAKAIKIGPGDQDGMDMGPLVSGQHRDKVASYIEKGKAEGAKPVLDGSKPPVKEGFFLGTSLFDHVKPEMSVYRDEIFGPVLVVVRVDTLEEAIALINRNPYANGTAIFTESGGAARRFENEVQVGMVGINVPIPVPVAFYSFGGWKNSLFGDLHVHGMEGVKFYTRTKVVTTRWPHQDTPAPGLNVPTLG